MKNVFVTLIGILYGGREENGDCLVKVWFVTFIGILW